MLVKDVIINVCKYLAFDDMISYLNGDGEITDAINENLSKMIVAVNIANNNVASNYIPIKQSSIITVKNKKILFKDFTDKSIIDISTIKSYGKICKDYSIVSDGIIINNGDYEIEFTVFPDDVDIDSDIDYYTRINSNLFAQAVASEFLYLIGYNDDANYWNEKFKVQMKGLLQTNKSISIPERRWL